MLKLSPSYLNYRPLALLVCTLLFSSPGVAAGYEFVKIAQQPQTTSPEIKAAADKAFAEGEKLRQQGTAESLKQAIVKYQEALKLYNQAGEKFLEAESLGYIGYIYDSLGEKQKALEYYNQSLPLYRAVGDRKNEATILTNTGAVYNSLGEKQKALEFYNQALPISRAVGDRENEATTLTHIGAVYNSLGEKQKALEFYNQALPISRTVADRGGEAATLNNIGNVYNSLGEKQKALEFYNQSLPISRALGDRGREATTLNNIGGVYDDLGEKQKALEYFNQALPLSRTVGDRGGEATTLNNIGLVYDSLGEKQKALEFYNQSLPILRKVGDRKNEAITLTNIGTVYNSLGEKQKALEFYNQSLPISRAVGDRSVEATTLTSIGGVYDSLGEKQKALEFFNQSLPILRAVGNRSMEATTLNNIGFVYDSLGEKQKALEYYNQSLPLFRALGYRGGEATTLNNIGNVYDSLGEKQKALEFYNQALPIFRAVGNRSMKATTLNNIGLVYDSLGEKQKALEFYNQALPILRAVGNRSVEATTLINIGGIYDSLGEKQKALEYYNQSLPISRAVGYRRNEAATLNNIGIVYNSLGERQKALQFYNQALPLRRAVGDRGGEATTLNNIGTVYDNLGEKQKALEFYNQALSLNRAVGDRRNEAITLNNIGLVYSDLGENQKALEYYNQSLPLFRAVGDRGGEANTLRNLAYLQRDQGNLNAALTQIQSAIKIIEDLRTKITSQNLRTSYFATVQSYYKFYIDLLMQLHKQQPSKGYDAIALQASESARARSLLELITEANADIRTGVDAKLLQAEQNIKQQLDNNEKRRVQLLSGIYTPSQKQTLETEITKLLDQYQDIQTQIRSNSPRYAAITQPQPLTLAQIQQQVLDENTILLEYSLGAEKSYLWAITKTGMTSYELPKNDEIGKLVKSFRNEIVKPASNKKSVATAAANLTKVLLEPVAEKLGNKRLVIVGDGALQYLPFAALTTPKQQEYQPLIVNHEIVTLPSASTVALLRTEKKGRKIPNKSLAMFADPVFTSDDQRFISKRKPVNTNPDNLNPENTSLKRAANDSDIKLDRLFFTRKEADNILKLVTKNQSLQAYDFAANRDLATNLKLSEYRILHFATHGILNSKQPELSGLVLSLFNEKGEPENGFLRLHDIFNLNLSADLVVLSACQTGLGEDVKGEGLVGLTTGFMYAGTSRVVVSLWSVNDEGTSVLMAKFYQKMLKGGLKPAAALREAQIEMLRDEKFSNPDYWAAFTVQGDWR